MSAYTEELSLESLVRNAREQFKAKFDQEPDVYSYAPGRVNLIGDHTDYNEGYVLPMTIERYTVIVGASTEHNHSTVITQSPNFKETSEQKLDLSNIQKSFDCKWINYFKGVLSLFPLKEKLSNFNALIVSNVPVGHGLSSSASLEIATFQFLTAILEKDGVALSNVSKEEIAKICQKAENEWADMPCGIMDQLISILGSENSALLIDCRNLKTELVLINKLIEKGYCFLIIASNVHHELSSSEYPKRRKVCEATANLLGKSSLRDVSMKELETSANTLPADNYQKARHVITEIERTFSGAEALKNENFLQFGAMLVQSHLSLKNDFSVTCKETDEIVDLAVEFGSLNNKPVFARQQGGGFGGSIISLLQQSDVNSLITFLESKYTGGTKLEFMPIKAGLAASYVVLKKN